MLDTGVVVAIERGRLDWAGLVADDDEVGLCVVSLAELKAGLRLAHPESTPRHEAFLNGLLTAVTVLPYDDQVVEHHARLLAWTRRHGVPRGNLDLIIAATAAATGYTLLTLDAKADFAALPGVTAEVVA
jgi:predicted nucleic acid-binding protein